MFEKGDYIIYGSSGVCRVEDITKMRMRDVPKDRLYYVLSPVSQKGGRIFTPVDNGRTAMRRVINREEAVRLIDEIPGISGLWITNEKQREEMYKECMRSCDCRDWVRIIKTLYLRRQERTAQGKKITATDEKYLKMAEDYLYSELEIPLEIPREEMVRYISERIESTDSKNSEPEEKK